jgi:hypothetical protein
VSPGVYVTQCTTALASDLVLTNNNTSGNLMVIVPGWHKVGNIYVIIKGIKDGGSMAVINDTIFALQGANTRNFLAYQILEDTWVAKCTMPYALKEGSITPIKKKVKAGGALTVYNNTIYAFKGGSTSEFWQYLPGRDTWLKKTAIPEYASGSVKRTKVKAGGALVTYGDSIYAFKGGNTQEFWIYNINQDTWLQRKSLIAYDGTRLKKIKGGASLTIKDNIIYALVGGSTNLFYSYTPGQDSWIELIDAHFGSYATTRKKIKDGASMVVIDNKIYAFKGGNTTDFGCYDISTPTNPWVTLTNIPSTFKVKAGGALCYVNDEIYAFIGGNCNELWKYVFSSMPDKLTKSIKPNQANENQMIVSSNFSVSPNPISDNITINYSVPISSKVSVKLYNDAGQLIKTIIDSYHTTGSYTYNYRLYNMENKIASGIYFLKYTDENNQKEIKVVIK